jgi:hypothetical protein
MFFGVFCVGSARGHRRERKLLGVLHNDADYVTVARSTEVAS